MCAPQYALLFRYWTLNNICNRPSLYASVTKVGPSSSDGSTVQGDCRGRFLKVTKIWKILVNTLQCPAICICYDQKTVLSKFRDLEKGAPKRKLTNLLLLSRQMSINLLTIDNYSMTYADLKSECWQFIFKVNVICWWCKVHTTTV